MVNSLNENVIAASYAASISRIASQYGPSEQAMLEGTGITPAQLHNPNKLISIEQNIKLTHNAVRLTGKPHLGLLVGQNLSLTAHGMMGIAVMSSKTYGDALKVICEYIKTRVSAFTVASTVEKGTLSITLKEDSSIAEASRTDPNIKEALHFIISTMASSISTVSKVLIPDNCNNYTYHFAHPTPEHIEEYEKVLGHNIHFNNTENSISAPASILTDQLPFYDESTLNLALENCNTLLTKQSANRSLKHRIGYFLEQKGVEFPDIEAVSRRLNMSSRTLRRKLQIEGTSYQSLINEKRLALAKKYLLDSHLSIIQIAAELNFSDPSYFSKLFKQWTGSLPTEFRKKHANKSVRLVQ